MRTIKQENNAGLSPSISGWHVVCCGLPWLLHGLSKLHVHVPLRRGWTLRNDHEFGEALGLQISRFCGWGPYVLLLYGIFPSSIVPGSMLLSHVQR